MITLQEFRTSLKNNYPPEAVDDLLKAMWYDGKNDWEAAHNIAQDIHTRDGSWIHAYLHRKEGDNGNASYWYHRAQKTMPTCSLDEEWEMLVKAFLK